MENEVKIRKKLPHWIPEWVDGDDVYFITINCAERGKNVLVNDTVANAVKEAFLFRHKQKKIYVNYLLIMPDHVHVLLVFGDDMKNTVKQIKRYVTTITGIKWQSDFFDHRIRNDEQLQIKYEYIRHNPVRKGLVGNPDDWKYQWWKEDF